MILHNVHREKEHFEYNDAWVVCASLTPSLIGTRLASARGEDDTDDETVQSKSFREDEDEDHAHKQLWLLCICPEEETSPNKLRMSTYCKQGLNSRKSSPYWQQITQATGYNCILLLHSVLINLVQQSSRSMEDEVTKETNWNICMPFKEKSVKAGPLRIKTNG